MPLGDVPVSSSQADRPPQFSLRALLIAVAVTAVATLAALHFSPFVLAAALFGALLLGAHVFGNALGTRLRALGSSAAHLADDKGWGHRLAMPEDLRRSRLHGRHEVARGQVWFWTAATSIGAAGPGCLFFTVFAPHGAHLLGILLGTASCAVLGGFVGFWASSLALVVRDAWREAARCESPKRR